MGGQATAAATVHQRRQHALPRRGTRRALLVQRRCASLAHGPVPVRVHGGVGHVVVVLQEWVLVPGGIPLTPQRGHQGTGPEGGLACGQRHRVVCPWRPRDAPAINPAVLVLVFMPVSVPHLHRVLPGQSRHAPTTSLPVHALVAFAARGTHRARMNLYPTISCGHPSHGPRLAYRAGVHRCWEREWLGAVRGRVQVAFRGQGLVQLQVVPLGVCRRGGVHGGRFVGAGRRAGGGGGDGGWSGRWGTPIGRYTALVL